MNVDDEYIDELLVVIIYFFQSDASARCTVSLGVNIEYLFIPDDEKYIHCENFESVIHFRMSN